MKRLFALFLLATSACGLTYTINSDLFRDMAVDKTLRLFDAENDVSISIDEQQQMRDRLRALKHEIRYAQKLRSVAERDGERDADDAEASKRDAAASRAWDVRVAYLEASRDYMKERIDAQAGIILLARAKFELAKAQLVKKNKLPGAENLDIKDFETQVSEVAAASRAELEALDKTKPTLLAARSDWLKARDALAASSLVASGTPGADEIPVWESW